MPMASWASDLLLIKMYPQPCLEEAACGLKYLVDGVIRAVCRAMGAHGVSLRVIHRHLHPHYNSCLSFS